MKVVHLIGGGDIGGAKTHVISLVRELSKNVEVKLISLRSGTFAEEAKLEGIDVEVIRSHNIFSDIKKVISVIKKFDCDIIHSHGSKANMFAMFAKHFTKLPTITTVHSDYKLDYMHSITRRFSFGIVNTFALHMIDYRIGVSKNFSEMLIKRKFKPSSIFTVYNGIDFGLKFPEYSKTRFFKKYGLNFNEKDILVGILARLNPVKGISTFIRASKEVVDKDPSVRFLICGEGEERSQLERKIIESGLSNNVFLLGWSDDPLEFMSIIDINVLASLSESFPYVILEGSRLRKATVSSDVGGISDLIESGVNGYLFSPGDYKKLSEHILEFTENSLLRSKMGEKLYQKAKTHYSLESMCKTQIDIYKKVLSKG
jgi:L-malate glycosyltransferase